jgi:hypothetical protein
MFPFEIKTVRRVFKGKEVMLIITHITSIQFHKYDPPKDIA